MINTNLQSLSPGSRTGGSTQASPPNLAAVLNDLNFDNAQAVRDAHAAIANLPALAQWYDQTFQGGEKTGLLACVATLILYQAAETGRQSCAHIPGSRQQALASLSPQLSATGKVALLLTVAGHPAANEFAQYFAAADRCSLAAQACRTEAGKTHDRGTYVRAAQLFAKAAHAHTQAKQHSLATDAIDAAVALYIKARRYDDATTLLENHARTHAEAGREAQAVAAYAKLTLTYESVAPALESDAHAHTQQQHHEQAAEASLAAARAYLKTGAHEHAARTLMNGARAYAEAGQLVPAKTTYMKAAEASLAAAQTHQKDGEHERAARTLITGAEAYAAAGQHELAQATYAQAVEVHEALAQAHAQAGKPDLAAAAHQAGAGAWIKFAIYYQKQCQPCHAGDAFAKAAERYAQAGRPSKSAETLNVAMTAYHGADEHMRAARVAEQYAQFNRAAGRDSLVIAGVLCTANAHAKGQRHTLAALSYVEAAELLLQDRHGTNARKAYQKAASEYQKLGQLQEAANILRDAADKFSRVAESLAEEVELEQETEFSIHTAELGKAATSLERALLRADSKLVPPVTMFAPR